MIFTDLEAWRESRLLVKMVYTCLLPFPKEEVYGLQSQIKRSVISFRQTLQKVVGEAIPKTQCDFSILLVARHMN
jgi:four helix bundle protein